MKFVEGVNLLIYPPDSAGVDVGEWTAVARTPVILFLHGKGERGNGAADLAAVARWGLAKFRHEKKRLLARPFPFLVAAPQCPPDRTWCDRDILASLARLCEHLVARTGDPARLYLTGFSMGGIGAFCLALRRPARFAALASVCGACATPEALGDLARLPLWIAYGEDDEIAELTVGSRAVAAKLGPRGRLVEKPYRLGHRGGQGPHVRTCDAAYAEPGLYHWFLEQTAGAKAL